jgi:hypothetical protein
MLPETKTMPSIHKFLLIGWMWFLFVPIGFAGTIGTRKIGSNQPLAIKYSPDPDATTSTGQMTITVSTAMGAAAASDRNLEIVLYVGSYSGKAIAYPIQLTLPQGALTATAQLHYLQPNEHGLWVVDVFEDRRSIVAQPRTGPTGISNQQRKTWLEITPTGKSQTSMQIDFGLSGITASTTALSTASEDWRAYLAFDAVAIPQSQLSIASDAQIQALSTYVLAGGNLLVHPAEENSATLELDRLMGSNSDLQLPDSRWESMKKFGDLGSKRSHGGGKLFALKKANSDINEQVRSSTPFPLSEFSLTGDTDFRWFWRNLVQSVGTAPVWGFIAFVTLFVIVVGPIVLRLTTVLRHRTLLLFLVPALSLIATLLVLFYNVAREGFGTHGRIASIQYLDEPTGQGFTWSRQSYFSGAPPRDGLKFPMGTLLKPVDGEALTNRRYYYDPRENVSATIRSDGESELISGWLLPRNQQQLLVGQRTDNAKLPIKITRISETVISVTNLTDQLIPLLFLRQSIDVAYFAKDLQPGQSLEIASESASRIDATHKTTIREFEPIEPESIDVNNLRYYGYFNRTQTSDPIDNAIRKFTCTRLDDFGFWILLQQSPDIPLPFDKSVYSNEKHCHIMTGVTQW